MTSLDSAYVDRPHYARQNTFRPLSLRSASPFTRTALPFARSRPLATSSGTNSDDSARQSLALSVTDSDYSSSKNSIHLIPVYNSRAATGGATNTGPKGVIADWRLATAIHHVAGHHEANLSGLLQLTNRAPTSEGSEYAGSIREGEGGCEKFCDRRRSLEMTRGKVFGHLREIGVGQFSRAIEEHSSIAFVIHLYEPAFEDCELLNYHLASIARAYPCAKFIRALASDMIQATDLDEATLPTVLLYRGGVLITSSVGINRDWGFGTRAEILKILVDNEALPSIPTIPFELQRGSDSQNSSRRSSAESAISW